MSMYHLPLDWRRAKFSVGHPSTIPDADNHQVSIDEPSYFVALERITDVLLLRNWLHTAALQGRYRMFGCYECVSNFFQGIVFVFEVIADMRRFRHYLSIKTTAFA